MTRPLPPSPLLNGTAIKKDIFAASTSSTPSMEILSISSETTFLLGLHEIASRKCEIARIKDLFSAKNVTLHFVKC